MPLSSDSSGTDSADSNGLPPVRQRVSIPKTPAAGVHGANVSPGRRRRRRDGQAGIKRRMVGKVAADIEEDIIISAREESERRLRELEINENEVTEQMTNFEKAVESKVSVQIEALEKAERHHAAEVIEEENIITSQAEDSHYEIEGIMATEAAHIMAALAHAEIDEHEKEIEQERVHAKEEVKRRHQRFTEEQAAAESSALGDETEMLVAQESIRIKAEQRERTEAAEKASVSARVQKRAALAAAAMKSQVEEQAAERAAAIKEEEDKFFEEERRKQKEYEDEMAAIRAEEERRKSEAEERARQAVLEEQRRVEEERIRVEEEQRRKEEQWRIDDEKERAEWEAALVDEERKKALPPPPTDLLDSEGQDNLDPASGGNIASLAAVISGESLQDDGQLTGGPMWEAAKHLMEEDKRARDAEEDALDHEFMKRRSKVPANLRRVDVRGSISEARDNAERREELKRKKAQISGSLLARAVSRTDTDSDVVPTAVAASLFRAVDTGSVLGVVEDENMPQSHGVINSRSVHTNPKCRTQMVKIVDDDAIIQLTPQMARKRTKVFQLFVIGLAVLIFGFFCSVYALTSCNFTSTDVEFGDDDGEYDLLNLHYGLFKYSPLDSAYDGYPFCVSYFEHEFGEPPAIARFSGCISVLFGSIALSVLWYYLITCVTHYLAWEIASILFILAAICQGLTFSFFKSEICSDEDHACVLGPGAIASLLATIMWFVGACEMHLNIPLQAMRQQAQSRASKLLNMELKHSKETSFWDRLPFGGKDNKNEPPSLSAYAKKNEKMKHRSDAYNNSRNDSFAGDSYVHGGASFKSYDPPTLV